MITDYKIIRSARRTLSVEITKDCAVVVRAPFWVSKNTIQSFVNEKEAWIISKLNKMQELHCIQRFTQDEIKLLAEQAVEVLPNIVKFYSEKIGVTYGRITVRNQRTRWGSCSSKGNLNFNCLLMLCPQEVMHYVIIHELCHLKELNHSKAFWALVEKHCPNYKQCKKWLKDEGAFLISRI